jgi:hypothetical protein
LSVGLVPPKWALRRSTGESSIPGFHLESRQRLLVHRSIVDFVVPATGVRIEHLAFPLIRGQTSYKLEWTGVRLQAPVLLETPATS